MESSECDSMTLPRLETDLPKLPPELFEVIVSHFQPSIPTSSIFNQPNLLLTLSSLSQVSHLFRHWSLSIQYKTLILPRSVREFKQLYSRLQQSSPPFICSSYTTAIFSAIPDIGRLSSSSAGWESDLLRLLHYCGERVQVLSLWESESRVLLRDTGQVRGGREGVKKKLQDRKKARNRERNQNGMQGDERLEQKNQKSKGGTGTSKPLLVWGDQDESSDDGASSSSTSDDSDSNPEESQDRSNSKTPLLSREELEAQSERERQTLPKWLEYELRNSKDQSQIVRNYKAHLTPTVQMREESKRKLEELKRRNGRVPRGCKPRKMSLMFQLPIFEHEDRELFRRMLCWKRCEELDVHVPITSHVSKALSLFSSLHSSPIKRLRISSIHATLVLALPPFSDSEQAYQHEHYQSDNNHSSEPKKKRSKGLKLTKVLEKIIETPVLNESLMKEFTNSPISEVKILEEALLKRALQGVNKGSRLDTGIGGNGHELIRIKIIQGNQAKWGKLKERLNDFVERAHGFGQGSWKTLGVWDD